MMLTKSKNDTHSGFTLSYLWRQEFEFLSPLPIDECASLLSAKSERNSGMFANRKKLLIDVKGIKGSKYQFQLQRNYGRNMTIQVRGQLHQWDSVSTLVTGEGLSDRFGLVIALLLTPFIIIMWATFMRSVLPILFILLVLTFITGYMIVLRQQMIKVVYDTLSDQIF